MVNLANVRAGINGAETPQSTFSIATRARTAMEVTQFNQAEYPLHNQADSEQFVTQHIDTPEFVNKDKGLLSMQYWLFN